MRLRTGNINHIHKRRQNGTQGLKTPFNHDGPAQPPRTRPVPALQWRPARREADTPGPLTGPPSSARGAARARSGRSWYELPEPPRRNRPAPGRSAPEPIRRSARGAADPKQKPALQCREAGRSSYEHRRQQSRGRVGKSRESRKVVRLIKSLSRRRTLFRSESRRPPCSACADQLRQSRSPAGC